MHMPRNHMYVCILSPGLKRAQLLAFSHAGTTFSDKFTIQSYHKVLEKIERNVLPFVQHDIVASLLASEPHMCVAALNQKLVRMTVKNSGNVWRQWL